MARGNLMSTAGKLKLTHYQPSYAGVVHFLLEGEEKAFFAKRNHPARRRPGLRPVCLTLRKYSSGMPTAKMESPGSALGRRILKGWKLAAGLSGILIYFLVLSHRGLSTYFTGDDVMNLVAMHGYWRWPWWRNALEALVVVTQTYRPMGDVFYRSLYSVFGFHALPFRAACYALMVLNLGLFFRFALLLSRSREAALFSTLFFSFHAALGDLYLSTGTVYDILCVSFTLAAFVSYASVRSTGRELQAKHIVILLLLYGGALDSKEMAASLPIGLVLCEVILARRLRLQRAWRRALPVLLVGVLTLAVLVVKVPALADNPL